MRMLGDARYGTGSVSDLSPDSAGLGVERLGLIGVAAGVDRRHGVCHPRTDERHLVEVRIGQCRPDRPMGRSAGMDLKIETERLAGNLLGSGLDFTRGLILVVIVGSLGIASQWIRANRNATIAKIGMQRPDASDLPAVETQAGAAPGVQTRVRGWHVLESLRPTGQPE